MSKEIRKNIQNGNPDTYDLVIGISKTRKLFSAECAFPLKKNLPVLTQRVREVAWMGGAYAVKHIRYPFLALELILSGEMEFQTEQTRKIAGPGALYVIPPGTTVKFHCHNGCQVRKLDVIMDGANLKGLLVTMKLADSRLLHFSDPAAVEAMIRGLSEAVRLSDIENSVRSYRFLMELAALAGTGEADRTPFLHALALMDSGFQENLQIPSVASLSGVSESTLRRLFRDELHCSPLEYLTSVRLKFAVWKLRHSSLRIKEIALMSGFLSSARFCTVFQEQYHMTPGEFRRKAKEKEKAVPPEQ